MAENSIRVICGPTGAGKSGIAMSIALEYSATIISADSRQIYRGFDIGTAKPGPSELKAVTHQGIDVADPRERYSAARWAHQTKQWIPDARARGSTPVIVGGTGFYLRALFDPLFVAPVVSPERRARLEQILGSMSVVELRRWCATLDPERSHLGRTQLVRAVETALLTGERISKLHARETTEPEIKARYLVVDPGASLSTRIVHRVDRMLDAGWANEVRSLAGHVPDDAPAWKSSGYRVVRSFVEGALQLSEARDRIIIETRQYAKRQRTWFRHQLGAAPVTCVNPDAPDCPATVERWWKESS
ncbi:MAG TPA: tRNA (adenosine(37)-N6)-dimethylallyltransferase MiaA [Gemmatimonadaceae bacterium]|nr:tRNA (adenosine(37)-N6)-dimethylallyltransferase MiaA [Gemmatimonadaceae bacterium]